MQKTIEGWAKIFYALRKKHWPLSFQKLDIHISFSPKSLWKSPFLPQRSWVSSLISHTASKVFLHPHVEVSVLFSNAQHLESLNRRFRNKKGPTNVLSFPGHERKIYHDHLALAALKPFFMGDLAFSHQCIQKESLLFNIPFESRLAHLMVHGVLHLCGHDHETPPEAQAMEALEIQTLNHFSYPNPYDDD